MMTTLCFDFGNSRKKVAAVLKGEVQEIIVLEEDTLKQIQHVLKKYNPCKVILSSVTNHDPKIEVLLEKAKYYHKLSPATKINFTTPVGKPGTIGADRLALMAAAAHFYKGKNNLIISLGSCITYNFLNQKSEFLGGGISPGLDMRFKAMHDHTALLPLVKAEFSFPLVGYDTNTNLQSGVINGMTAEINGIIDMYKDKYRNFNAVLTGGNSTYFAHKIKNKIFADYNFLFKGLYALSELNNGDQN